MRVHHQSALLVKEPLNTFSILKFIIMKMVADDGSNVREVHSSHRMFAVTVKGLEHKISCLYYTTLRYTTLVTFDLEFPSIQIGIIHYTTRSTVMKYSLERQSINQVMHPGTDSVKQHAHLEMVLLHPLSVSHGKLPIFHPSCRSQQ